MFPVIPEINPESIRFIGSWEAEAKQKDRERFMALTPEQQELELKLRAVEALEEIAKMRPEINVKSSIF